MLLKQTIEIFDLLEDAFITGAQVIRRFAGFDQVEASYQKITGEKKATDFIKIIIKGTDGKQNGGKAPTLGIIGRLGGIGARPEKIGLVSDADGAITAVAAALKLSEMSQKGDRLAGDVIVTTHICPSAPTEPHEPVDFMGSPVDMQTMNTYEVDPACDALLSIDTTKGNHFLTHKGYTLSPVVKEGYILPVSADLIRIMETTSGESAQVFPLSMQDITPYGNDVYHVNSILQPATATAAPVVGVAITTATAVAGSATGASHEVDVAQAANFAVETAKAYTAGQFSFYDEQDFTHMVELYGSMNVLQTFGKEKASQKEESSL